VDEAKDTYRVALAIYTLYPSPTLLVWELGDRIRALSQQQGNWESARSCAAVQMTTNPDR